MSTAQKIASQRFLDAMGTMVNEEQIVTQVILYINSLHQSMTRFNRPIVGIKARAASLLSISSIKVFAKEFPQFIKYQEIILEYL